MSGTALILFGHGARDPQWAEPMQKLQARLRATLPQVPVELAFLEVMEPRLPPVAQRLADAGCERIVIVPVFLGQGGHVKRDLAALVQALRETHPRIAIDCAAAVGEDDGVLDALAAYCVTSVSGR